MTIFKRTLIYITVGTVTYIFVNRFFPGKKPEIIEMDPDLVRGGAEVVRVPMWTKLLSDPALKIGIMSVFLTHFVFVYQNELVAILSSQAVLDVARKRKGECAKLINDFAVENDLEQYTTKVRELIVKDNLTFTDKVKSLKYKLGYILKGKFTGKKRALALLLIGIVITCSVTGIGGLCMILDALKKLFEEGKISEAVYIELVEHAKRKFKVNS